MLDSILGSKNARGHTYDARIRPQSFDPVTNITGKLKVKTSFAFIEIINNKFLIKTLEQFSETVRNDLLNNFEEFSAAISWNYSEVLSRMNDNCHNYFGLVRFLHENILDTKHSFCHQMLHKLFLFIILKYEGSV